MSAEHVEPKPGIWFTFTWGLIGILLFTFVVIYMVKLAGKIDNYEDKLAAERLERLHKLGEDNQAKLTTYDWVDKAKGTVRIPLDRAMELELSKLQAKTVRPAALINPPVVAN